MNNTTNYRIFVEKLPRFRVEAESLRRELGMRESNRLSGSVGRRSLAPRAKNARARIYR